MSKALIVVDIQKDFMPDGALPVPEGYETVEVANEYIDRFRRDGDVIVATQDWHPPDHGSFASNHEGKDVFEMTQLDGLDQILWPDHCVQGSEGAEFVKGLDTDGFQAIFRKGIDSKIDSYSGFYDNDHRRSTGLSSFLEGKDVEDVYILGVATDVCVRFTALDSVREGFNTYVVEDGCRGVNMEKGDVEGALEEMSKKGVKII